MIDLSSWDTRILLATKNMKIKFCLARYFAHPMTSQKRIQGVQTKLNEMTFMLWLIYL